jgi:hypothetical protein
VLCCVVVAAGSAAGHAEDCLQVAAPLIPNLLSGNSLIEHCQRTSTRAHTNAPPDRYGHAFEWSALSTWVKDHHSCPLTRQLLRTEQVRRLVEIDGLRLGGELSKAVNWLAATARIVS